MMRAILGNTIGAAILLGAAAQACTVPVFRYALDRWQSDAYRLEVPEGWSETPAGQALAKLTKETQTPLDLVPVTEAGASARFLMPSEDPKVVWSGNLADDATSLFLSPARDELAKRILAGESMVWVMVTSGDAEKDKAFEALLKARLEYLGTVAAIPEQDPNDPESQLGPGPELRVGFSLMTIARDDPSEQIFLKMLSGPEGRELLEGSEPFAGVVFGRGRVLGAWDATELDEEGIDEVSLFLLGACSCRVKFQNPGWDLAMAVDWESRLMAAQMAADNALEEDAEGRPEETTPAPAPLPETVTFDGEANDEEEAGGETGTKSAGVNVVLVGGVATVLVLLAGVAIMKGKRN